VPARAEPVANDPEASAAAESERLVAWLRLPAVGLLAAGQQLGHPNPAPGAFAITIIAFAAWSAALLAWVHLRPADERLGMIAAGVDVVAITALAALSGGPFSQARLAYFLVSVAVAFRFRPSVTAFAGAATVAAYLGQAFAHPARSRPEAVRFALIQAGYLAWVATAAVLLSYVLRRRTARSVELALERERLMAEAMAAEERERRALAEGLHDTAIQNLLSARHDLEEASETLDAPALARADRALADAVTDLREALFELHPYVLEAAGLEAALTTVGNRAARRGRFRLQLDARPVAPSRHEQLLLAAARELFSNVAKHADARHVQMSLAEKDGYVVLGISDDGKGFDETTLSERLAHGHIGIASHRARVESVGGRFEITSSTGRGTRAEVRVPRA
jgi:two-component system, NarL family, sensor kinase